MNCEICGKPLPDGVDFCPSCGAVIRKNTVQPTVNAANQQSPASSTNDTFAITSLVLAIAGFVFSSMTATVLGIVFGVFGLKSLTQRSYAVAGIVISSIGLVIRVLIVILAFVLFFSFMNTGMEYFNEMMDSMIY